MRGHPGKHALVVAAESMSGILTRATPDDPKAKTVGSALFGDGCAAAVLSNDPHADGPIILDSQVHQLAGTLGAVRLDLTAEDSYLHLARDLPDLAGAGLPDVVAGFLRRNELERSDIDHWMAHPGGRRIVENVQSALALSPRTSPRAGTRSPSTATSARPRSSTYSRRRSSAIGPSRASAG